MLDLPYSLESTIIRRAKESGLAADAYLAKLVNSEPTTGMRPRPDQRALDLIAAIRYWESEDMTEDEDELERRDRERTEQQANLDRSRLQAGMRPLFGNRE